MSDSINILFLCTGNSCRSQMAEGWARALGGNLVRARSAGIEAHGQNPRAVAAMDEAGVDISGQSSDRLSDADLKWADLVVTVCGHADEQCPVLPDGVSKRHWLLDDPAHATGTEAEIAQVFRDCRDEIRERMAALLNEIRTGAVRRR